MRVMTIQSDFTGGELDPKLYGRVGIPRYQSGLQTAKNVDIMVTGGATRRAGTKFVYNAGPAASTTVRQIPFVIFRTDTTPASLKGYVVEFRSDNKIRFYVDGALILSGGNPYEIASPFASADLSLIKYEQFNSGLYLVHPDFPPQILTRTSDTAWTIAAMAFNFNAPSAFLSNAAQALLPNASQALLAFSANYGFTWTWTEQANPKNFILYGICWSPELALFVAVGAADGTDAYILTSPDGSTWTERANAKNVALYSVIWSGTQFVAVGSSGGGGVDAYILTSPDGSTWTERAPSVAKLTTLFAVCWSGTQFVAVGSADGTDAYILTSPDGITWTERANAKNIALFAVCWSGTQFVAVGAGDGTDAYILTSPDGITWTERANPKNFTLSGICWSGTQFLAVGGADGTDAYILTSPDGSTWTERANAKNVALYSVIWSGTQFLAVGGADGTDAYILTSPDGSTWTERTNPKNYQLRSVYWTGVLFIAVGANDGTDAYIITTPLNGGLTRAGYLATVVTSAPHNLRTGYTVAVAGADQAEYNGTFQVTVVDTYTFTYPITGSPTSPAAGVITITGAGLTRSGSTAMATTAAKHNLHTGAWVVMAGATQSEYNGTFVVTVVDEYAFTYEIAGTPAYPATGTITATGISLSRSGSTATATTQAPHNLHTGASVTIAGATQTDYNGTFVVTVVDEYAFTYEIAGTPATPATGTITAAGVSLSRSGSTATATSQAPHNLKTGHVVTIAGAAQAEYNGTFQVAVLNDYAFTYTISGTPVTPATGTITWARVPWGTTGYPAAITFFEQRMILARTKLHPQTIWGSETNNLLNFVLGVLDSSPFEFVPSAAAASINQLLATTQVLALTNDKEIVMSGGSGLPLTPTNVQIKAVGRYGSKDGIRPLAVGGEVLFATRGAQRVRAMAYKLIEDSYKFPNIAIMAEHLLDAGILELWQASEPESAVYVLTSDGKIARIAYDRDQEVVAFSRYETDGLFKGMAVVQEGLTDQIYVTVERVVNGTAQLYTELFDPALNTDCAITVIPPSFIDRFDNASFDTTNFGSAVVAGGLVGEATYLKAQTFAPAAVALVYSKDNVVKTTASSRSLQWKYKTPATGVMAVLVLEHNASTPASSTEAAQLGRSIVRCWQEAGTGQIVVQRRDAAGTASYWSSVNQQWEPASAVLYSGSIAALYRTEIQNDGAKWRINLYDGSNALLAQTGWVLWSDSYSAADPVWMVWGDLWNNVNNGLLEVYEYKKTDYVVSGLSHLEGKAVDIVADGQALIPLTVTSGQVTLPVAANSVEIGLHYDSELQDLRPEVPSQDGTAQGRTSVSVNEIIVRLENSRGCVINGETVPDTGTPFRGDKKVSNLGWGGEGGRVQVQQTKPLPFTVLAIIKRVTVND